METLKSLGESRIGELVAEHYRTATIFKKHKIDFCCQGDRTVAEACDRKKLDLQVLAEELEATIRQDAHSQTLDYRSLPLDYLCDYIERKHHSYVSKRSPELQGYLHKLCRVHGDHSPELHEIAQLFNESAGELAAHMKKEELILFPHIRKMVVAAQENGEFEAPQLGGVKNPIAQMRREHENEGERFRRIAELSHDYSPPEWACNTYRVTYKMLQEFETDLHLHIHLENNILFPQAGKLEAELQ